jgi:hypothetical protein
MGRFFEENMEHQGSEMLGDVEKGLEEESEVEDLPETERSALDWGDAEEQKEGLLPSDAKAVFKRLLHKGQVSYASHSSFFDAIKLHEPLLRTHFSNMDLILVIDELRGLAFIQQKVPDLEEGEAMTSPLINVRTLSLLQTWIVLALRKHYQEKELVGDKNITITLEMVMDRLKPFLPPSNSESADKSKVSGFLKRLVKEQHILSNTRADEESFQISPIIRHVLDINTLDAAIIDHQRHINELGIEIEPRLDMLQTQEAELKNITPQDEE